MTQIMANILMKSNLTFKMDQTNKNKVKYGKYFEKYKVLTNPSIEKQEK